ncbi:hypothetical protein CBR_g10913 [Chara braunii]|uniref:CNH domain-containing protein n=1 Tax=Chara braunii TaxID=69332 RepID=A0A388KPK8_CHABU|nr:hypothetical protein CBR_g10913 [Chara braunii]|eukprot:GBG71975.1 hypothetical protein CBR_g10913 [Chara braunii]
MAYEVGALSNSGRSRTPPLRKAYQLEYVAGATPTVPKRGAIRCASVSLGGDEESVTKIYLGTDGGHVLQYNYNHVDTGAYVESLPGAAITGSISSASGFEVGLENSSAGNFLTRSANASFTNTLTSNVTPISSSAPSPRTAPGGSQIGGRSVSLPPLDDFDAQEEGGDPAGEGGEWVGDKGNSSPVPSVSWLTLPEQFLKTGRGHSVDGGREVQTRLPAKLVASRVVTKAGVRSMCVLRAVGRLVVVTLDGHVAVVDEDTLENGVWLSQAKGTVAIAKDLLRGRKHARRATVDGARGRAGDGVGKDGRMLPGRSATCRFVVACQKKLVFFESRQSAGWVAGGVDSRASRGATSWTLSDGSLSVLQEMSCFDGVVDLLWMGESLFLSNRRGYLIYRLREGGGLLPLFSLPADCQDQPLMKAISSMGEAVLTTEKIGVQVDARGQPTGTSLLFDSSPSSLGQSPPFLMAVIGGNSVDVYNRRTGAKVQRLDLPNGLLGEKKKGSSSSSSSSGLGWMLANDDNGSCVIAFNETQVWYARPVALDEQLKELLRRKEYAEAVTLAEESVSEAPVNTSGRSERGGGGDGLSRLAIVQAEVAFLQFFDLCFGKAVDMLLHCSLVEPPELFPFFPQHTARWHQSVPRKRYWSLHPPPQPIEEVVRKGLSAIENGILGHPDDDGTVLMDYDVGNHALDVEEQYVLKAKRAVAQYLKASRPKVTALVEKEGTDTLLARLYIDVGMREEMEVFVSTPNSCVVEELEIPLRQAQWFCALALLFESRGLVHESLQIWDDLGNGRCREAPYGEKDSSFPSFLNPTGDGFATEGKFREGMGSALEVAQRAVGEASRILQSLSDVTAVLKHGEWILREDPALAFAVFTSKQRKKPVPADDILQLLRKSRNDQVYQWYLQHVVMVEGSMDGHLHTELAIMLAGEALQESMSAEDEGEIIPLPADSVVHYQKDSENAVTSHSNGNRSAGGQHGGYKGLKNWVKNSRGGNGVGAVAAAEVPGDDWFGQGRRRQLPNAELGFEMEESNVVKGLGKSYAPSRSHPRMVVNGVVKNNLQLQNLRKGKDLIAPLGGTAQDGDLGSTTSSMLDGVLARDEQRMNQVITWEGGKSSRDRKRGPREWQHEIEERPERQCSEGWTREENGKGGDTAPAGEAGKGFPAEEDGFGDDGLALVSEKRQQLQAFLKFSDRYEIEAVLSFIADTNLWQEQVILNSKQGNHTAALRVLALKLSDLEEAERYCGQYGGPETYKELFEMYLHPGDGRPPLFPAAIGLLNLHGDYLNPIQVLEALSDDLPLHGAVDVISWIMQERVHRQRLGQVVKELNCSKNLLANVALVQQRARYVAMNDERACWSCHARIGTKLFALHPNHDNAIVCYQCFRTTA